MCKPILCLLTGLSFLVPSTNASEQKREEFPYTISWKTQPTKPVKLSDVPNIVYEVGGGSPVGEAEVYIEFDSSYQEKEGSRPVTNTMATTHRFHLSTSGEIPSEEWTDPLKLFLKYYKARGNAPLRIALVKARTKDNEMPKSRISNRIELSLRFSE